MRKNQVLLVVLGVVLLIGLAVPCAVVRALMKRASAPVQPGPVAPAPASVLPGEEWETDFSKASAEAKSSGKHLLLDFSGSDWCGWCIRLEEEVFSKPAFKEFAKEKLVLVLVDFPRRKPQTDAVKRQNGELKEKYGIPGYPTVILLSPSGELAGRTGYREGGAEAYVAHLKGLISKTSGK